VVVVWEFVVRVFAGGKVVTVDEVVVALRNGNVIEDYSDDPHGHSCLVLGFCGGEIMKDRKNFTVTRGDYCLIIHDVHTDVCSQCVEASYDIDQWRAIEKILKPMDNQMKKLQARIISKKP